MPDDEVLLLRLNPQKVMRCLASILDQSQIDLIQAELNRNARQLHKLAQAHLRAARQITGQNCWRQQVSRGYYACYSMSKAVRLAVNGYYSTKADDHEKVGSLPDDFPSLNGWTDLLTKFRGDRNMADYDHSGSPRNLELSPADYLNKAAEFLSVSRAYLKGRGAL
jgi:hypothetical protein